MGFPSQLGESNSTAGTIDLCKREVDVEIPTLKVTICWGCVDQIIIPLLCAFAGRLSDVLPHSRRKLRCLADDFFSMARDEEIEACVGKHRNEADHKEHEHASRIAHDQPLDLLAAKVISDRDRRRER